VFTGIVRERGSVVSVAGSDQGTRIPDLGAARSLPRRDADARSLVASGDGDNAPPLPHDAREHATRLTESDGFERDRKSVV